MKLLKKLGGLLLPGSLILLGTVYLLKNSELLPPSSAAVVRYAPYFIFVLGLLLSAVFHRSRLFLATLILAVADCGLRFGVPRLSTTESVRLVLNCIAILIPLNLLALCFMRDRGIISPAGRWRAVLVVLQAAAIVLVTLAVPVHANAIVSREFVYPRLFWWSHVSQIALLTFSLAALVMIVRMLHRRRSVDTGLFWALVASFVALNLADLGRLSTTFFASGGLILTVAVLETTYAMAFHDELTELPARRAFNDAMAKVGNCYTLAMVDIDHFKQFNDEYGHETGDHVLRMVASKLDGVSGGGKAFRYGGEEFAVLFPGKLVDESYPHLERVRKLIEETPFAVRGVDRRRSRKGRGKNGSRKGKPHVTVSIGVAECDALKIASEELIRAADKALYRAKSNGRNCTVISELQADS